MQVEDTRYGGHITVSSDLLWSVTWTLTDWADPCDSTARFFALFRLTTHQTHQNSGKSPTAWRFEAEDCPNAGSHWAEGLAPDVDIDARKARRILRAKERMTSRLASPCDQIFRATFGHDMLSAPRGPHRGMDKNYVPATEWLQKYLSSLGFQWGFGLGTGCSGEELADWPCSCWRKTHCCAFPCLRLILDLFTHFQYTTCILLIYYLYTTYILLIYYLYTTYILIIY